MFQLPHGMPESVLSAAMPNSNVSRHLPIHKRYENANGPECFRLCGSPWISRSTKDMPTWAEFAQCVAIAVLGLGVLLFGAHGKRGKSFKRGKSLEKPPVSAARIGLLDGEPQ
jgi:hypothetical protein